VTGGGVVEEGFTGVVRGEEVGGPGNAGPSIRLGSL
jgi:hypothetical protein